MPTDFISQLEEELRIYSFLKNKFRNKLNNIPKETRIKYGLEEMEILQKNVNEYTYLQICYLLGFSKKPIYKNLNGKAVSEYVQAKDYVKLLYCFDEQMNKVINYCSETKTRIKNYYKYINKLAS